MKQTKPSKSKRYTIKDFLMAYAIWYEEYPIRTFVIGMLVLDSVECLVKMVIQFIFDILNGTSFLTM